MKIKVLIFSYKEKISKIFYHSCNLICTKDVYLVYQTTKEMATLIIHEKTNSAGQPISIGETIKVETTMLIGVRTKRMHVRTGYMNGTLFLSQSGHGAYGGGDIIKVHCDEGTEIQVNRSLFGSMKIWAEKAGAIV